MEKSSRVEGAVREVVRRRETQHLGELFGSASEPRRLSGKQGGNYLGRRAGRQAHADLSAIASRSLPICECAETKQRQEERPRHHLSAEYSRNGDRHAGMRSHRCGAFSDLRRL